MIVSLALLGAAGAASGAPLADIFVDASANCAAGTGAAATPFCAIADAVAVAVSGDTIRIAAGTYLENLNLAADISLVGTDGQGVTVIDGGMNGAVVTVQSSSMVAIDGVTIQGGSASGILNEGGLTLMNSTVTGNTAGNGVAGYTPPYGGGIRHFNATGSLTIDNCSVSYNSGNGGTGGGVFADGSGQLTILDSTFNGNTGFSGAAVSSNGNDVVMRGSTITANTNLAYGVVYAIQNSNLTVVNSTISTNSGGGVDFGNGICVLRNSTIVNNDGQGSASGVYAYGTSLPSVKNTVVAGQFNGGQSATADLFGDFTSDGHNFIGVLDVLTATGFVDGTNNDQVGSPAMPRDPMLGSLGANGGPTLTHRPMTFSPLIGAADQQDFEPLDQRGVVRSIGFADIGSTEDTDANTSTCISVANSTGATGTLTGSGSTVSADDNFTLNMGSLPLNQFGIFLVSLESGFQANPGGSAGNLCLGGAIGRFFMANQILSSGPTGVISLQIPLTMLPQGNGFVAVQPGDTWFFQGWHRDVVAGAATSNFSTATAVLFN